MVMGRRLMRKSKLTIKRCKMKDLICYSKMNYQNMEYHLIKKILDI